MFSFIKNLIWPARSTTESSSLHSQATTYEVGNNKRKAQDFYPSSCFKRPRVFEDATQVGWTLDLEQANYKFSSQTISIFKGTGTTVLVSRQQTHRQQRQSLPLPFPAAFYSRGDFRTVDQSATAAAAVSVLRGLDNLPGHHQQPYQHHQQQQSFASSPRPSATAASAVLSTAQPLLIHSTPLTAVPERSAAVMSTKSAASAAPAVVAAPSTVPKASAAAAAASASSAQQAGSSRQRDVNDEDCVITSVEGPKSVAEMFSPCKYLSSDWLADIKTSSQSLKSYMNKVETEETLKMQYWAKRRQADEADLVARVTRNLKLAEREHPVLPYKYEEPPPTPPPTPPPPEEQPAELEFPDLTEEQLRAVERAWSRQLPGSEVVAEGFSLRVTRDEMRSLSGLNWLNDNIVNFYMQLVAARGEGPGMVKVHAFSTFFYTKLSTGGYASVRRWTRKVDIFEKDVLLCPVHLHNNHWTLSIVDLRSRYIIHLDSLSHGGAGGDPTCLPLLRQYLAEEHRDKKGSELDVSEFQLVREIGAPQQENGSDCGVFCCKFADYYCKGREFTFRQCNMPYFRKRTTLEILEKRLLW